MGYTPDRNTLLCFPLFDLHFVHYLHLFLVPSTSDASGTPLDCLSSIPFHVCLYIYSWSFDFKTNVKTQSKSIKFLMAWT